MLVSVVYALPGRQIVREVELPDGATLAVAMQSSGLLREFPEIDPAATPVGVYGQVMPPDTILHPGDRVEIYRPLGAEPKVARRKRASKR